jgi:hypothetical protein
MRLFTLAKAGLGALEEAMPSPNAGCITKYGNTTVTMP